MSDSKYSGPEEKAKTASESTHIEAAEIVEAEEMRIGKDEMNLVEYPFALLSYETQMDVTIKHEWEARHPVTKKLVKASWRVEGSPEMGMPTATDERVYLVLMEMTKATGFHDPTVLFTRYDLLQRLGWPDNQKHYDMVQESFERLKGVVITSRNAFWDSKVRSFRSVGFNILDNFDIATEQAGRKKKLPNGQREADPVSYFRWNSVIFQNAKNGYIKSLDLGFALSLSLPLSLRLFRFLDKKTHGGRTSFEIELRRLCEMHLGMAHAPHLSTYKVRLKNAHSELTARGFLLSVSYSPMKTRKTEKVCYEFPGAKPGSKPLPAAEAPALEPSQTEAVAQGKAPEPPEQAPEIELRRRILEIGVSTAATDEMLRTRDHAHLRIQLDCLRDREPKNAAATFVKAVREVWALPQIYVARIEAVERAKQVETNKVTAKAREAQERASTALKRASEEEESAHVDASYAQLDEMSRQKVDEEVISRLGILGRTGHIGGALTAMRRQVMREWMKNSCDEMI